MRPSFTATTLSLALFAAAACGKRDDVPTEAVSQLAPTEMPRQAASETPVKAAANTDAANDTPAPAADPTSTVNEAAKPRPETPAPTEPADEPPTTDRAAAIDGAPADPTAAPPVTEGAPFKARATARWCLVASTDAWEVMCESAHDPDGEEPPPEWVTVHCEWDTAWDEVPWDVLPTEIEREPAKLYEPVSAAQVMDLGACGLGMMPPSAAANFVAFPQPTRRAPPAAAGGTAAADDATASERDTEPTSETAPRRPPVVKRALPTTITARGSTYEEWQQRFAERTRRRTAGYRGFDIDFGPTLMFDANGDGKDEQLATYSGSEISDPNEESFGEGPPITEGLLWIDGRRPNQPVDRHIVEGNDFELGLTACGLIEERASGLPAIVLHDSRSAGCLVGNDQALVHPLDPTRTHSEHTKPLTVDAVPIARVRNPDAGVFNRNWSELGALFGFRRGMSHADVIANLNTARAPTIEATQAPVGADGTMALASGPTFIFDATGRLTGLRVPSRTVADALQIRGFDSPLLDLLGQSANAAARALGGRRPETLIFDGNIDKAEGLTLTLNADTEGRVDSFEIHWYPRRKHLDANPPFLGLRLGKAPDKLPRPLAKIATATDLGWRIPEAGVELATRKDDGGHWLASVSASVLPSGPAALLAKEPLLGRLGETEDAFVVLIGEPDMAIGDTRQWLAPSAGNPAWRLTATMADGKVTKLVAERAH